MVLRLLSEVFAFVERSTGTPSPRQQRQQQSQRYRRQIVPLPSSASSSRVTRARKSIRVSSAARITFPVHSKRRLDIDDENAYTHPAKRLRIAGAGTGHLKPFISSNLNVEVKPGVFKDFAPTKRSEKPTPAPVVVSRVHAQAIVTHLLDSGDDHPQDTQETPVPTRPAPLPPVNRQLDAFKKYLTPQSELKLYQALQRNAMATLTHRRTPSNDAPHVHAPMIPSLLRGPRTARDRLNLMKCRMLYRSPKASKSSRASLVTDPPRPPKRELLRYAVVMNFHLHEAERQRAELLRAAETCQLECHDLEGDYEEDEEGDDDMECIIPADFDWSHPDLP